MIRRAATYLLFITLMMYLLRWLHYQGLLRQEKGYYAKYKTAFFQKNAYDILFLGSSRAEMHYNTVLFDSLCGKNSFNLSLAGATPRIAFAALKAYLHNSDAPSELIYEADYHALQWPAEDIKEFNNYFPFLKNPVLLREFSRIDRRMPHFYLNPFYSFPYTGLKNISTSLHGWLGIANATDSLYFKGFVRETRRPALRLTRSEPQRAWIHPVERQYLDSILTLCKAMQIRAAIVSSPIFAGGRLDVSNKKQITGQLRNIARSHGVTYTDLSSLPFCANRKLFIDHFHMNAFGAENFTRILAYRYNNKQLLPPLK